MSDALILSPGLAVTRAHADRAGNLRLPLYRGEEAAERFRFHLPISGETDADAARAAFDRVCLATPWAGMVRMEMSPFVLEVMLHWIRRCLPALGLVPADSGEHAELRWSRARCFLGGVGHAYHGHFARACRKLWPDCPLDPDEPAGAWGKALGEARAICGWPVHLAVMSWGGLVAATPSLVDADIAALAGTQGCAWWRACATLHTVKHARREGAQLVSVHAGRAARSVDCHPAQAVWDLAGSSAGTVLGAEAAPSKARALKDLVSPLRRGVAWWLSRANLADFLPRKPLSDLPGILLAGAWSALVPCPAMACEGGFVEPALRPDAVWVMGETVEDADADAEDAVAWSWPLDADGAMAARRTAQHALSFPLPDLALRPSQLIERVFPHLVWMEQDADAHRALLDALVCLNVHRAELGPDASREFPFLLVLPEVPSPDQSTQQGKTTLACALVRSWAPDVAGEIRAPVGGSSVDSRALAHAIETCGTLCLDEFVPHALDSSPLSAGNIQTLCTGGTLAIGKVMENAAAPIRLRSSLGGSAKLALFPPDVMNRLVPLFIASMDQQQAQDQGARALAQHALHLHVRRAAAGLRDQVVRASALGGATRWPVLAGIAAALLGGDDAGERVARMASVLRDALEAHCIQARESGLVALTKGSDSLTGVGLLPLLDALPPTSLQRLYGFAAAYDKHGLSPGVMLDLIATHHFGDETMGASEVVGRLLGQRLTVGRRALLTHLQGALRAAIPVIGTTLRLSPPLEHFAVRRVIDNGPTACIKLLDLRNDSATP